MPSPLTLLRRRHRRRADALRRFDRQTRRLATGGFFLLAALGAVGTLVLGIAYADVTADLPSIQVLPILLNPVNGALLEPTRLYDRSGQQLLLELAPTQGRRVYLTYKQIPAELIQATLAIADPRFWEHGGYTLTGWRDPRLHPTLAQRLAAELLLWDEAPSVRRAIRERILAAQITARYGREKVLEWYLNSAYFGNRAWGVEAAAQLYFGKSATQVNLSEAALLAAVSQAPALNPFDAPQAAESERIKTLQSMALLGLVTPEAALSPPPAYASPPKAEENRPAPAFLDLTLAQLRQRFGQVRLERGGLTVFTTLDYALQQQAECALQTRLQQALGTNQEVRTRDGSPCAAALLLPALPPGSTVTRVTASALILDPRAGQVLAVVGDTDQGGSAAYLLAHPAGTLLTPFLYLTGFTRGLGPASLGWDIPGTVPNLDGRYRGPVRLRLALVNDYLPPAAAIVEQMGMAEVQRVAASFGLDLPASANLFSDEVFLSPLQVASAYAILANQGTATGQHLQPGADSGRPTPVSVWRVVGVDNAIWADWGTPASQAVVSPQLAYLLNHVLSDEGARQVEASLQNAFTLGRPLAVKVGRTFQGHGAWIVGYTPQRLVVVWVEAEIDSQGSFASASEASVVIGAGLWRALMEYALGDLPSESWPAPAGIVRREVCDPSGLLPSPACPSVVSEVFLSGNEPQHTDTLYQALRVNRETGLLATVFTPPELVEQRVYLVVPPQARAWAEAAGLAAPPTAYDTVTLPPPDPNVHITSPALFADVGGNIRILGTAAGEGFVSYRLEYGSGLNPDRWLQLGQEVTTPVREGLLAEWDTRGLDGLYALRLLVSRADGRLEQAAVVLNLDNTPPQATILYPQSGESISKRDILVLRARVDDMALMKVAFYLDDTLLAERAAAPFEVLWKARPGPHVLRLEATDRAGNHTSVQVEFRVEP